MTYFKVSEPLPIMNRKGEGLQLLVQQIFLENVQSLKPCLACITFLNLSQNNMAVENRLASNMAWPFKTVSSARGHKSN